MLRSHTMEDFTYSSYNGKIQVSLANIRPYVHYQNGSTLVNSLMQMSLLLFASTYSNSTYHYIPQWTVRPMDLILLRLLSHFYTAFIVFLTRLFSTVFHYCMYCSELLLLSGVFNECIERQWTPQRTALDHSRSKTSVPRFQHNDLNTYM